MAKKQAAAPRTQLTFIPPTDVDDDRLPGGKGQLFPLRSGQVLLVCEHPGDATDEQFVWVQRACQALVDDGMADAAIYVPMGWKLQTVHTEDEKNRL